MTRVQPGHHQGYNWSYSCQLLVLLEKTKVKEKTWSSFRIEYASRSTNRHLNSTRTTLPPITIDSESRIFTFHQDSQHCSCSSAKTMTYNNQLLHYPRLRPIKITHTGEEPVTEVSTYFRSHRSLFLVLDLNRINEITIESHGEFVWCLLGSKLQPSTSHCGQIDDYRQNPISILKKLSLMYTRNPPDSSKDSGWVITSVTQSSSDKVPRIVITRASVSRSTKIA